MTARGYIIEDSCKHDIMNEDEEIIVNLLRGPDDYASPLRFKLCCLPSNYMKLFLLILMI